MINFPESPSVGQPFTAGGVTWIWDGVKWVPAPTPGGGGLVIATGTIIAGSLVLNALSAGVYRVSLSQNITSLSITNIISGKINLLQLELFGNGTAYTINWGSWQLVTGVPVPTSAVGQKDIYSLQTDGTNTYVWLTAQNVT